MGIEVQDRAQDSELMKPRRLLDTSVAKDTIDSLDNAQHQAEGADVVVDMLHVQYIDDKIFNDMVRRAQNYRRKYPEAKTIFKIRKDGKVDEKMKNIGVFEMKGIEIRYEEDDEE